MSIGEAKPPLAPLGAGPVDRIVKKSESCGGVKIGEATVQRLLFVHIHMGAISKNSLEFD